jgi:heme/copper-type cytochrome/quinol oxidase subunit 4
MYARLWWKDARQFWPIWVILVLAAVTSQCLIQSFLGPQARYGTLGVSAWLWANLYALTAGAAAFAGERETGTLQLLDVVPVDRRVVWRSKVSFALVTTLALMLVLQSMALLGTKLWSSQDVLSIWELVGLGTMVLLALGWGLIWSSILGTALSAAVTAIACTMLSFIFLTGGGNARITGIHTLFEILLIAVAVAGSKLLFTRSSRSRRLNLRSPIVVTQLNPASSRQMQLQSPIVTVSAMQSRELASLTVESRAPSTIHPVPKRSWIVEARNIAWQTIKEGFQSWCLLATIVLVLALLGFLSRAPLDGIWVLLTTMGVTLAAGVNVFGLENQPRTQRFLSHHGARAGLVWLVKLLVWSMGLMIIWGLLAIIFFFMQLRGAILEESLVVAAILPLLFAVGLLCGMACRRGITAFVIAIMFAAGLVIPLLTLVTGWMLPAPGILVVPLALLAVSWAWSTDWMVDRPALGRWLRLGLFLSAAFGALAGGYVAFRIESVRDVGPITPPAAWGDLRSSPIQANLDAAELYREAGRRLVVQSDPQEFLKQNRDVLDLIRQAAARPECRFNQSEKLTLIEQNQPQVPPYSPFMQLTALNVRDRQDHGDFASAWVDIMVMFRMARHFSAAPGHFQSFATLMAVEREALGLAMEWAIAKGQTPERLEEALSAYRDLPKIPTVSDAVRTEANLVDKTLDLPVGKLRDWLIETTIGTGLDHPNKLISYMWLDFMTTPWERARARRVNHLIAVKAIEAAIHAPSERFRLKMDSLDHDPEVEYALRTTPSAMKSLFNWVGSLIEVNDRNEVGRRVLVQILAIRVWQLRHDGRFPESLEALLPKELPSLPKDPYTGRPFLYVPSTGEYALPLRFALSGPGISRAQSPAAVPPGSRLLYSVAPKPEDHDGTPSRPNGWNGWIGPFDLVFAIPPIEGSNEKSH